MLKYFFLSSLLLFLSISSNILFATETIIEADLENGKKLHRVCTLCHGQWSQGINGGRFPRLAGFSIKQLKKQLIDFKTGKREQTALGNAMIVTGNLKNISEKDLHDLSAFIFNINLDEKAPLNIKNIAGDAKKGKKLYKNDCKTCHGRQGEGKESKNTPPLSGQYIEYLTRQIDVFKTRHRKYHDNDPEDEAFDEYSNEEIRDILAYISTLEDK
jgi:cytochrome c553